MDNDLAFVNMTNNEIAEKREQKQLALSLRLWRCEHNFEVKKRNVKRLVLAFLRGIGITVGAYCSYWLVVLATLMF